MWDWVRIRNGATALGLVAFATFTTFVACGGNSSREGGGGDGKSGNAGNAGSSGGGAAGSGTTGGAAGSANGGTSGQGGTASGGTTPGGATSGGTSGGPTGGVAGAGMGGDAGSGRECETADDCVRIASCCDCSAAPAGTTPPSCSLLCGEDRCFAEGIGPDDVTCAFGRCVIDRSCNLASVLCNAPPEPCPDGQVRFVEGGCFGGCIAPTECRDVTDCTSCGNAVCVIEEPQIPTVGCVDPGTSCTKGNYCECLDACPTSGYVCMEADDAVHCPCPVC